MSCLMNSSVAPETEVRRIRKKQETVTQANDLNQTDAHTVYIFILEDLAGFATLGVVVVYLGKILQ